MVQTNNLIENNNLSIFFNNFIDSNKNLFDKLMNKTFNYSDLNNTTLFYLGVLCIFIGILGLMLN
jgi:hypothetical protein